MGKSRKEKTPAPRPNSRPNEIYVTRSKPLSVYEARARKLLEEGYSEVVVHGLGMAIPQVVALGLALAPRFNKTQIQTSSVQVIDEGEGERSLRPVSALHLRLTKEADNP